MLLINILTSLLLKAFVAFEIIHLTLIKDKKKYKF